MGDNSHNYDYYGLLKTYSEKGNNDDIAPALQFLKSYEIPEDDKDAFFFLSQLMILANKNGDKKTATQIREISNRMKNTSGSSMMRTVILESSLKTETDCIELIEECLKNGFYESALDSIVDVIKANKDIAIATRILTVIENRPEEMIIAGKERIANQFIDRVDGVLINDAVIRREIGLFGRYYAKNWPDFFVKDFKNYLAARSAYKKSKFRIKREESDAQRIKRIEKEKRRPGYVDETEEAERKRRAEEAEIQKQDEEAEFKKRAEEFIKNCSLNQRVSVRLGGLTFSITEVNVTMNGNTSFLYSLTCNIKYVGDWNSSGCLVNFSCKNDNHELIVENKETINTELNFTAPIMDKVPIAFKLWAGMEYYKVMYDLKKHTLYRV